MKDKEKQIEEMAKVNCEKCSFCDDCDKCKFVWHEDCEKIKNATALYNAGYRKIDKDSVVLTLDDLKEIENFENGEWTSTTTIKKLAEAGKQLALKELEQQDKVMLSREEYEKLKHFEHRVRSGVCFTQKEWFDYINKDSNHRTSLQIKSKEEGSKETAEKILNELYCTPQEQVENKIKDLARFIGVEIKE